MRNHRKPAHAKDSVVHLPDGTSVTLDRPFSEYTIEELAALGIKPGLGGEDLIAMISRDPQDGSPRKETP
ncbi:hypothetical protein [Demequina sp.]|uniref:hypothetical protein n=1 Tax=Demequina sp. TaxID=2050685 RepID=UPI003D0D1D9C